MKIKDSAIIGVFHAVCTFIIGFVVYLFSPKTMPLDFCFWVSMGAGLGRFCLELFKANKIYDKMIVHFKTR